MRFLLDAQLPPSLKQIFISEGYDCLHTLDLESGNETSDKVINTLSVAEQIILITKDSDFFDSYYRYPSPGYDDACFFNFQKFRKHIFLKGNYR